MVKYVWRTRLYLHNLQVAMHHDIFLSRKGKYINYEERKRIEKMLRDHMSIRWMARTLDRSHSTILSELSRKPQFSPYTADLAQRHFLRKQETKGNVSKLETNIPLREMVVRAIKQDWSPEQIAKRLKRFAHLAASPWYVCHETVYEFIYTNRGGKHEELYRHLRRHHRSRKSYKWRVRRDKIRIPERVSIHEREVFGNTRNEFGHLESDSMIFSKQRAILSVQVDRKWRLTRMTKLPDKTAEQTSMAVRATAREFQEDFGFLVDITYDNGTENAKHVEIKKEFSIQSYFCDPYCSWQKGTVENTNALIRQYLPRNIDLEKLTHDDIYKIQEKLNNRPRKCLNYLTPNEYMSVATNPNFTIKNPFP